MRNTLAQAQVSKAWPQYVYKSISVQGMPKIPHHVDIVVACAMFET
jgi:hypothetical protein